MEPDNEIELDLDDNITRDKKRLETLSSKVKETAEQRDALAKAKAEEEAKRIAAEKERDFYATFSDSIAKYPQSSEYKDKIKEKVMSGYTVEDATVAVLNAENKLVPAPAAPPPPPPPAAGGSAVTNPPMDGAQKQLSEMSREEKRQALLDAEKRGDIGLS